MLPLSEDGLTLTTNRCNNFDSIYFNHHTKENQNLLSCSKFTFNLLIATSVNKNEVLEKQFVVH